jgi:HK97 family phage prohead protease
MSAPVATGPVRMAGYASVFDVPDKGRDVVRKGAFARAAAAGGKGVPLLWQHDAKRPIGTVETLREDARGLRVIARLADGSAAAGEAAALLRSGAIAGLSFGYRVIESTRDPKTGMRELTDLDLLEVSLVTFPMQPLARVHAVEPPAGA